MASERVYKFSKTFKSGGKFSSLLKKGDDKFLVAGGQSKRRLLITSSPVSEC